MVKFGQLGFGMGKTEKVHFSGAVVFFDIKCIQIQPPRNSRGQSHLVTLAKGHLSVVSQHFQELLL